MSLSQSVIDDLAVAWIRLHRSAAQPHLEHMLGEMRRSGDADGVADYGRILTAVLSLQRTEPCGARPLSQAGVSGSRHGMREDLPALSPQAQ